MKKFIAGFLACSAIRSIEQDIVGKEAYIQLINYAWVSAWYTVPLAVLMLVVAFILYDSKIPID